MSFRRSQNRKTGHEIAIWGDPRRCKSMLLNVNNEILIKLGSKIFSAGAKSCSCWTEGNPCGSVGIQI
jgi:hypothetical protein